MKLSDLRSAAEIHEQDMQQDPEYRREYDRLKLANDVAVRVLAYRTERAISQTDLARKLGMRQPNIARLESGEHEPSLSTLARLSSVLGVDFSVDIKPGGLKLRPAPRARKTPKGGFTLTKMPVKVTKVTQAKDPRRRNTHVLGERAGLRPADSTPPQGTAGRPARSLPRLEPADQ